jgi:uncharacterized protein YqiB (DUF1249 family)
MDIYHRNYRKLLQLIPTLHEIQSATKLTAPGYMDLDLDIVERHHKKIVIELGHHFKHHSGDMIPDPDMTITVYSADETVEVLTYQDCFGFRQVYRDDMMAFSPTLKAELNSFLDQWLTKLLKQGHKLRP